MSESRLTRPVTQKVWGGKIRNDDLLLRTGAGEMNIPWDKVEALFIGRVVESFDASSVKADSTSKRVLDTMPLVGRISRERSKKVARRANFLSAFLFAEDVPAPFRFDNIGTNYKELLGGEAGYSSEINFTDCMKKIIDKSTNLFLGKSASDFNEFGRGRIHEFGTVAVLADYAWKMRDSLKFRIEEENEE